MSVPIAMSTTTTPPEQENGFSSGIVARKLSRKSHRKSRNGCQNCKQRKIKCDEKKPQCANCSRHSVHCRYPHGSPQHVSSPEPSGMSEVPLMPLGKKTEGMGMSDLGATTRALGLTQIQPQILAPNPLQGVGPMQSKGLPSHILSQGLPSHISTTQQAFPPPQLAPISSPPHPPPPQEIQHPLPNQMARHSPRPYRQPLNVTDLELLHHYNISTSYTLANDSGLQTCFRINVPQIGVSYPFVLHGILALAALHLSRFKHGAQKAHYISEAQYHYETALDQATALMPSISAETCSALYLFTTSCLYITLGLGPRPGDFLLFGEGGPPEWLVMHNGMKSIVETCGEHLRNSDLAPLFLLQSQITNQGPQSHPHLDILRDLILASNSPDTNLYLSTLTLLARSFPAAPSGPYTAQASPHIVFAWLYRLDESFVAKLRARESIPLVLLAHFCVLFNSLKSFWWTRGWVEHLMGEIYGSLGKEFRLWVKWPMEEIGWVPG
ncbi:Zn2/Cys6 DNA-binding protein [Glarea lozoyensis ATCC 20868]|uniref:Zn2/Cys6 DNA-binding protein n=1 Tax=Glarea lozoyensis (strain ATCC 20868 / MF5171) TaxID=1116229 RepID=S3E054_GLAL2|nr:Zn2/Cys6 DNA-binding protein [Glarea lozoyensis ATCC 20868]EPE31928.1 Zn2/Cys6 DNA-binding protein [Glarea lozoyensis ATCC 20868]